MAEDWLREVFEQARRGTLPGLVRHPVRLAGDIDVFSPEEVWALVRATASEQDAAIFLTAAFTGLRRGELIALHWRHVRARAARRSWRGRCPASSRTAAARGRSAGTRWRRSGRGP
jgi:integrase